MQKHFKYINLTVYGIDGKFEFIFFVLFNIEIISSEAASNFKNSQKIKILNWFDGYLLCKSM